MIQGYDNWKLEAAPHFDEQHECLGCGTIDVSEFHHLEDDYCVSCNYESVKQDLES